MSNDLLNEIETFLARSKLGSSYFGKAACGNSEVVERLRNGGTVTLVTAQKIRDFINSREAAPDHAGAI